MGWMQEVPSAPGRWPLLGHAVPMARDPLAFLLSLAETGDLVRIGFGGLQVLVVTSVDVGREVLTWSGRQVTKGRLFDNMLPLVGDGLATADRETHRRHRRIIQPQFSEKHLARYAETMTQQAERFTSSLREGQRLDVGKEMSEYAINTLVATMFARDPDPRAVQTVRESVGVVLDTMLVRAVMPPWADRLPISPNRRFLAASRRIRAHIEELIEATPRTGLEDGGDLVSTLLAARDSETGDGLTDAEVRDELATILFAGTETTGTTMAWALHEMATHPEVQEKVLAELHSVLGEPRPVTYQDTLQLPYLRSVLEETLRLHGVTLLMRRTLEPIQLRGVEIPADTEIAFSLYALHRDRRLFGDDAEEFNPERGHDTRKNVPFGAGTRKCIGNDFSWTEAMITLATLLPRWELTPAPGYAPREALSAMPRPAGKFTMQIRPRTRP